MAWSESDFKLPQQDWGTPAEVLVPLYEHFGEITLDPFSNPHSIVAADFKFELPEYAEVRAAKTIKDAGLVSTVDALTVDWRVYCGPDSLTFCNGPFGSAKHWVPYAVDMHTRNRAQRVELLLLLPVRTGSVYWQKVCSTANVIAFWSGRMHFHGAPFQAPFHTALVYWGHRAELMQSAWPKNWCVFRE